MRDKLKNCFEYVIMENLKGIIKDPTIEQFLKQYPTEKWCEMLKKNLNMEFTL